MAGPDDYLLEIDLEEKMRASIDAVLAEFALRELKEPARVVYVVPGEAIVWDATTDCAGGQLTIRLSRLEPHRTAATRGATLTPCSIDYWTATLELIMLRCAAVVDNQGQAPSAAVITEDGRRGLADLGAILRALASLGGEDGFVDNITQWTPQGPTGAMFGNGWNFTLKLDSPPCD